MKPRPGFKIHKNDSGFKRATWEDSHEAPCSIQESSADGSFIWLGISEVQHKRFPDDNTGWHDFELPEKVSCHSRMHLNKNMAAKLVTMLQKFIDTGEL